MAANASFAARTWGLDAPHVRIPVAQKRGRRYRLSPSMFVDEAAPRRVADAVDQPLRQRAIVALVDGDVAMVFVGDDMMIDVAGERPALRVDGGREDSDIDPRQ